MTYQGIDTAAKINAAQAKILRSEGISFVGRYLVPDEGNTAWKALTETEAAILRDAGLAILLCWETSAKRMLSGAEAGGADGARAKALAQKIGVPFGTVIYFAADWDVQASELPTVESYLRAARVASAPYRAGVYGGERVCKAAADWDFSRWQCVAWTNEFVSPVIQYQWQGSPDAREMTAKLGVAVDLDAAETLSGMWAPIAEDTTEEDALKWAKRMGIIDDSMKDVSQTAVMLYRYHNIFSAEDAKSASGLLG